MPSCVGMNQPSVRSDHMAGQDGNARCGARTRRGTRCEQPAGFGTSHVGYGSCRFHGGHLPGPIKAAAREALIGESLRMGLSLDMRPEDLMLTAVRSAAGALQYAQ